MLGNLFKRWQAVDEEQEQRGGLRNPIESPAIPITGATLDDLVDGQPGDTAGQRVHEHDALSHSPVWSAVDLISSKIAELPWLYQKHEDGSWVDAIKT